MHDGRLVTAELNSAGTLNIRAVDDVDGVNPDDLHPNCRVVRHGYLGGRAVAFMGGDDGVARVWDLDSRKITAELVIGQPILQIVAGYVLFVRTASEVVAFKYSGVGL